MNESWIIGQDAEPELKAIHERHYSKYHYRDGRKTCKFVGPGETIVLTTPVRDALFVWQNFIDHTEPPQTGICCSIFRNESTARSSDLIREADAIADFCWAGERHYTKVRASSVKSRNPGWCFICAGWSRVGTTKGGLVILAREVISGTTGAKSPTNKADASTTQSFNKSELVKAGDLLSPTAPTLGGPARPVNGAHDEGGWPPISIIQTEGTVK